MYYYREDMKKVIGIIIVMLMPVMVMAETYPVLWKKVMEARSKDLPRTQMEWLDKIIDKAQAGADYGQMLKAQLWKAAAQTQIAPDSAEVEIERIEENVDAAKDPAMKAVYATVLGKLYEQRANGKDESQAKSKQWFAVAMAQPEMLAQHKCAEYAPAVVSGVDSKIFYDDLLHVVGMEARAFKTLHDYYAAKGNRAAACICATLDLKQNGVIDTWQVRKSKNLQAVDSLLHVYGDLREAGELAIEHYQFVANASDVTVDDQVNYINYALSKWGDWPRMNILRNAMSELRQPSFNINIGDVSFLPQQERLVRINFIRNINTLTVNIYRVNVEGDCSLNPNEPADWAVLQKKLVPGAVQTLVKRYVGQPAWKENTDSLIIGGLPVGMYVMEATTDNGNVKAQRALLHVSDVYVMCQGLPDNQQRFVVVNATTGEAIAGAHLRLKTQTYYDNEKEQTVHLTTDKNGEAYHKFKKRAPNKIYAYTDNDKAGVEIDVHTNYSFYDNDSREESVRLYTDRAVYRPGQMVRVAAIAYLTDGKAVKTTPLADKQLELSLFDANGKEVSKKTVTTDSYGTASADFTLPQAGLTGAFSVRNRGMGYVRFNVEEYKLPTYEVTFDSYKEAYQPGDTVQIRGWAKTYSGVPVQDAKVSYKVCREPALWWFRRSDCPSEELRVDTVVTADDGSFVLKMPMVYPEDVDLNHAVYYHVVAYAKVTDNAGETHEEQATLALSNRSAVLKVDLPSKTLRDSLKTFTVTRTNLAQESIEGVVRYCFDGRAWKTAEANKPIALDEKLASGRHQLEVICGQDTVRKSVVVFTYSDKKPVVQTHDWFYLSEMQFPNDGSPVYLQVGTSDKNTHVYYSVFAGNKTLAKGVSKLSDEVVTRKLYYKEEYGDGVVITMAWVKNGKMYKHEVNICRPTPDNKLKLTWKTFRDKLTPGQREQWTLHIDSPEGKPAMAQLLATMYDKSLDDVSKLHWRFTIDYGASLPHAPWRGGSQFVDGLYGFERYNALNVRSLDFSHFDGEMFNFANPYTFSYKQSMVLMARQESASADRMAKGTMLREVPVSKKKVNANMQVTDSELSEPIAGLGLSKDEEGSDESASPVTKVRENFNETAFFYPALTTDGNGNVNIAFTLPESVTTWKFMALAHDEAFNYGQITAEAVAKKVVMVQPNMPRFVRQGDESVVVCRIANTSEKDVRGKARLQIVDPETNKMLQEWSAPFEVKAGQTTTAEFTVDGDRLAELGRGATLFVVRTLAEGQGFSDGEQRYLPLLPNQEFVTTTLPFTQVGAGVKTLDISKMFPSNDKRNRLTVEYTNNPAWLMIQALPTVANPTERNAVSLAAAIYANSLARQLMVANPSIGQTVKLWQKEQGTETSLVSNLQRNSELKTMLLSETPWVSDANRETEQKQQLINYLDESAIDYRLKTFADKLSQLQNPDGSFSWWPNMPGNKYMTMEVTTILARLNTLTGQQENSRLLSEAFKYLDRRIADEVKTMKKESQKKHPQVLDPSEFACNYLYASALAGRKPSADMRYLLNLLEKKTTKLTIYGKARSAVILAQYGFSTRAKEYLQSLNEYAVYKEEMGRYYDTHHAYYSWRDYRIPTQVAAIEAMKRLTPQDTKTIEAMQRWLLQEKRTQSWDTPVNAVDAVYAFLATQGGKADMDKLATQQLATMRVDGKTVELPRATAGLGYVKTMVDATSPTTIAIEKTSAGTSWGALYAQYWQKASEVEAQSSGLKVKREVIVNGQVTNDKSLNLRVGDKVKVRITIVADRDYDFVQVQDKRAACLEPAVQLSGYRWGYYCAPQDNVNNYYFDLMAKGEHVVETDYYVDRQGSYASGICTVQCAYSPEFAGREGAKCFTIIR